MGQTTHQKAFFGGASQLYDAMRVARGEVPADLVIKGAQWLDVFTGSWRSGDVAVYRGVIVGTGDTYQGHRTIAAQGHYIVPGFIDAHVHIESSMMTPRRFEQAVLPCGTTTAIWDPHEIANVRGVDGIRWALAASEGLCLSVFIMVPSCVPATSPAAGLESAGAVISAADLREFIGHPRVLGLAEMMNVPGLLGGDPDVLAKMNDFAALRRDGHCPGLTGKDLNAYAAAGIHSCHESTQVAEADEKLSKGIHLLIREGSCAKDAATLLPLLTARSAPAIGFCSDDRNPLDIHEGGHVSAIVDMALRRGLSPVDVFRAAAWGPARMYGLNDRGAIAPGYRGDLCIVGPLANSDWQQGLKIQGVIAGGKIISAPQQLVDDKTPLTYSHAEPALKGGKNLNLAEPNDSAFAVPAPPPTLRRNTNGGVKTRVIGVRSGQIITDHLIIDRDEQKCSEVDLNTDILKIAVLERHHGTNRHFTGFVRGFGLKAGAIATSINHDSHNVIVVGTSSDLMVQATAALLQIDGGIVVVGGGRTTSLPLPLGGLMTNESPDYVAERLRELKMHAASCGCVLPEPFLQLSFLALPVIPSLKITDRGLVDVAFFKVVPIFADA